MAQGVADGIADSVADGVVDAKRGALRRRRGGYREHAIPEGVAGLAGGGERLIQLTVHQAINERDAVVGRGLRERIAHGQRRSRQLRQHGGELRWRGAWLGGVNGTGVGELALYRVGAVHAGARRG